MERMVEEARKEALQRTVQFNKAKAAQRAKTPKVDSASCCLALTPDPGQ